MVTNPLVQEAMVLLKATGFTDTDLIRESYYPQAFGNAEAIFRVGKLIVRFLRDRSQDFVDLASISYPEQFHQICDVEVAMGWKSFEQLVEDELQECKFEDLTAEDFAVEDLTSVLDRLFQHFGSLEDAFSGEQEPGTRALVEKVAKERFDAYQAKMGWK